MGGDSNKHYITIFMTAQLCPSSAELVNLEPHKCSGWEWMPWSDIMEMKNKKDLLFEPMINLLDGLGADGEDASNPSFF